MLALPCCAASAHAALDPRTPLPQCPGAWCAGIMADKEEQSGDENQSQSDDGEQNRSETESCPDCHNEDTLCESCWQSCRPLSDYEDSDKTTDTDTDSDAETSRATTTHHHYYAPAHTETHHHYYPAAHPPYTAANAPAYVPALALPNNLPAYPPPDFDHFRSGSTSESESESESDEEKEELMWKEQQKQIARRNQ